MSGETINILLWHPEKHIGAGSCSFPKKNPKPNKQSLKLNQTKSNKQTKITQRKSKPNYHLQKAHQNNPPNP